jgi:phenylacetate-CoA ligase
MSFREKYREAIADLTFRTQELLKGHSTFEILRRMNVEQWFPRQKLEQLQQKRLVWLLRHSAANVPYYAELFKAQGLRAQDLRTQGMHASFDLTALPFLTKDLIRNNLKQMKSRNVRRVRTFSTGGSTGAPLKFYLGPTRVSSDIAGRMRAEGWFGISGTDPEFAIWGSPVELSKQDHIRNLRDRMLRTRLLSAFEMNVQTMDRYLDEITRCGCRRIFGYPSSIALLCERARRQGRDLSRLGVKAVFVTAEYLYEHWRKSISEAFGCPVANGYGGRDSGFVAHECPAGGMHITADRIVVEIVDDRGRRLPAGHSGEIVVTHLDTPEMPFIRYRTGDVGALANEPCVCGRTLPLLERIEGRTTDFVIAPDGRVMHGLSLIYVVREIPGIEAFRITQKQLSDFEVEIVRTQGYDTKSENRIREGFSQRLRASVSVRVHYSDSISPTASGKTRHIISEVNPPAGIGWDPMEEPVASGK